MKGILADINVQGQVDYLVRRLRGEPWSNFWEYLNLNYLHFAEVGLRPDAIDSVVWATCQAEELVLITDNRNQDWQDSLEATIRLHNTESSLPVMTISDAKRVARSRDYATRIIDRLLDILMRMDDLRGAGRLYLP